MFDFRSRLFSLLLLTLWVQPAWGEEKLGIFYPSVKQPKDVQKTFGDDAALKDIKVLAFGSFEDFQTAVTTEDLTYALLPSSYPKYYEDFEAAYQLTQDGKTSFQNIVVTLDHAWTEDKLGQGIVGVINNIGREKTKVMVEEILAGRKFKRLKQVSKIADLYPLLALGNAQYAIFSPHDLDQVKTEFASKPIQVFRTAEVQHPIIAVKKGKKGRGEFFLKLNAATLKILGVNGIKAYAK